MAGRILGIALAACLALPAGAAASVLYVGDSLGVGTSPYLRQQLDGTALSVDAEIGRPSGVGVDVLRSEIAPEHDAVIFDLGTNDDPANPDALAADLAAAPGTSPAIAASSSRRSTARRSTASPSTRSTAP